MGVSKVVYSGRTLIDLTSDTVSASTLLKGYKAHDKAGNVVTGTYEDPYISIGDKLYDYDNLQDSSGQDIQDSSSRVIEGQKVYGLL